MIRRLAIVLWALSTSVAAAQSPRVDAVGQPLPPDAIARVGTSQFVHRGLMLGGRMEIMGFARMNGNIVFINQAGGETAMRFSPDGKFFVTYTTQGVRVWDPASGRLLFRNQGSIVRDVFFHPKNGTIYFVGAKPNCWGWDPAKNEIIQLWDKEGADVVTGAITPNGMQIALGNLEKLLLLDLDKQDEPRAVWKSDQGFSGSMTFSPDGKYLALANANNIRLIDCKHWRQARSYAMQRVLTVAFRPDSKAFAAVGNGGLKMFHTEFEEDWPDFGVVNDAMPPMLLAADGKSLIGGRTTDKGLHMARWDINTGKEISLVRIHDEYIVSCIDPTHKRIAIFEGNNIRMLDAATGKNELSTQPYPRMTSPTFADPAGKLLGCVTDDNAITFWDTDTGKLKYERRCINANEKAIAISPRGKWITAWANDERTDFILIEAESGNLLWQTSRGQQVAMARALTFSPDDRFLLELGPSDLLVWDPKTGKNRKYPFRHQLLDYNLGCSPDGRLLLIDVQLHEIATGEVRHRFTESPRAHAFSPDNKHLALIKQTGLEIDVVAIGTYHVPLQLSVGVELNSVAFSADSRSIAAGDTDGFIHIWDADGTYRHRFGGHSEAVIGLIFSQDGRRLASTSEDRTSIVWDLARIPAKPRDPAPAKDILLKMSWNWLADRTGPDAGKAMTILQSKPKETIAHFRTHIIPDKAASVADVSRWLKALDSSDYAARDQAMKSLEAADAQLEDVLRKKITKETPAETKRRIEQLLYKLEHYEENSQRLREVRAVEVLERIGSDEARALLKEWADGAPAARLTREAKVALERLQLSP